MTTKFSVGDEVYIRGKIKSIKIDGKGAVYKIKGKWQILSVYTMFSLSEIIVEKTS